MEKNFTQEIDEMNNMSSFIKKALKSNPEKYGVDGGDFHLVNAYFRKTGQTEITAEQRDVFIDMRIFESFKND